MNTRITCLLLILIAHAFASAAPKFLLTLEAGIEFFSNGEFRKHQVRRNTTGGASSTFSRMTIVI